MEYITNYKINDNKLYIQVIYNKDYCHNKTNIDDIKLFENAVAKKEYIIIII
jgi:hypothetical protein